MTLTANFHTHTTYCDGEDTPAVMAETAAKKGFTLLGFSAHGMYPYASAWHMGIRDYTRYTAEIRALQKEYEGKMDIALGFEADYLPPFSLPRYSVYAAFEPDYLIGSVHFLTDGKSCFTVDGPAQEVSNGIRNVFGGNAKKAVQAYFAAQRDMMRSCDFDIVGHADVIRKRNGELRFFDETEGWYRGELEETAKTAATTGKIVEINTGGIARGMMTSAYPSPHFLKLLNKFGVPVIINSDAHTAKDLDCAFDTAVKDALEAGYAEITIPLKKSGSAFRQNLTLAQ